MKHRHNRHARHSNELLMWIVIIFIIFGLIYVWNYYLSPNSYGYFERNFLNYEEKPDTSSQGNKVKCPEEIIPEEFILNPELTNFETFETSGRLQVRSLNTLFKWKDGQNLHLDCHHGQYEGENINLVYCNDLSYSKTTTPIYESGIVGKTETISYVVDLVLKEKSVEILELDMVGVGTDWTKPYIVEYPITTYEIISSECYR